VDVIKTFFTTETQSHGERRLSYAMDGYG